MKKLIIFTFYAVGPLLLFSQTWQWAQQGTGNSMTDLDRGSSVVVGNNGNIYCTGTYKGTNIKIGSTDLYDGGLYNMYVCEYDSNGNLLNVSTVFGNNINSDQVSGKLAVIDSSGNLFVFGSCYGQAVFDTVVPSGGNFGYIALYNANGRCLWVKTEYSQSLGSLVKYNDNIYVTGGFSTPVSHVDTFTVYNPDGLSGGESYLTKLDATETPLWVKQTYGYLADIELGSIRNSYLYFTGITDSCFVFDTINKCGQHNVGFDYVVQTDTNGSVQWISSSVGTGRYVLAQLSTDMAGNCYAIGGFNSTFYIGGDTLYNNAAQVDGYLAKYNRTGNLIWVKQLNSNNSAILQSIYTDCSGNSYITGYFAGAAMFGSNTITAQSPNDLFVARYDSSGVCLGVVTAQNAIGTYITGDQSGNAIVTGYITASTSFGSYNLTCNDGGDFFVAKMGAITGTGLRDIEIERLQIYANPNTGTFTVVVPQTIIGASSATLSIYNNNGSLISQQAVDLSNNKVEVELGTVSKGIYNVALNSGQKSFSGSVVIQ